jgi:hypothetical protein
MRHVRMQYQALGIDDVDGRMVAAVRVGNTFGQPRDHPRGHVPGSVET